MCAAWPCAVYSRPRRAPPAGAAPCPLTRGGSQCGNPARDLCGGPRDDRRAYRKRARKGNALGYGAETSFGGVLEECRTHGAPEHQQARGAERPGQEEGRARNVNGRRGAGEVAEQLCHQRRADDGAEAVKARDRALQLTHACPAGTRCDMNALVAGITTAPTNQVEQQREHHPAAGGESVAQEAEAADREPEHHRARLAQPRDEQARQRSPGSSPSRHRRTRTRPRRAPRSSRSGTSCSTTRCSASPGARSATGRGRPARLGPPGCFRIWNSVPSGLARLHSKGRRASGASDSGSTKTP